MTHSMNLPWVESPFFYEILKSKKLDENLEKLATDYYENGYVVIENAFSPKEIEAVISDTKNKGFNPEFHVKTFRDERRVQDLWQYSDAVKQMACKPSILELIELFYEKKSIPFQTLNFIVGSQQKAHSDTMHFSSLPARYMCGVWVALEDITEDNGPLYYYPKSHRTPEYNFANFKNTTEDTYYHNYKEYEDFMESLMEASTFEKKKFCAKKGDALIWSSNIIHGGCPVNNPKSTRLSQVTHYYFEDCVYYTPMLSNMVTNELFIRRFLTNIRNGEPLKQSFNGNPINMVRTRDELYILNNRIKLPKILRYIASKLK